MISDWSGWQLQHPDHRPFVAVSTRLGEIQVPTLVVVGEHDLADFLAIADHLEAHIPGARKVILPGVGHMANMEDPKGFNDVVMTFLSSH